MLKTLNNSTFLSQEYQFCQGFEISVEGEEASSNVCSMVERAGTGSRLIHQRGCKLWTAMMLRYMSRECAIGPIGDDHETSSQTLKL